MKLNFHVSSGSGWGSTAEQGGGSGRVRGKGSLASGLRGFSNQKREGPIFINHHQIITKSSVRISYMKLKQTLDCLGWRKSGEEAMVCGVMWCYVVYVVCAVCGMQYAVCGMWYAVCGMQ